MKKLILISFLILMMVVVLVSCVTPSTPHTHEFTEWSTTKNATCTEDGVKTRYCSCGEKQSDTIPSTGHSYNDGVCENCGDSKLPNTPIVPEPSDCEHKNTESISPVEATCTESGLTEGKKCSDCDTIIVEQETVAALGHNIIVDAAVEATCTETGLTLGEHCSRCDHKIEQGIISALGHTDENPKDYICDICKADLCTEHSEETIPAKAATCTESGLTEGKKCSICGEILVAQQAVSALGHTEVIDNAVAPDCVNTGLTEGKHCSVCGNVIVAQIKVDAKGHSYNETKKASTCTEYGYTTYTCNCGYSYIEDYTDIIDCNYVNYICTMCGASESTPIEYFAFTLLDDGTYSVEVQDRKNIPTDVIIPRMYNNKIVTKIKRKAFYNCTSLNSVKIPDTITSIDAEAFYNCTSLTSVEIPDIINYIGGAAFSNCTSLIYNEHDNAYYLGNNNNPYIALITTKDQKVTNLNIHNATKIIYTAAFSQCKSLERIVIPDDVIIIGVDAFYYCKSLKNVTFGKNTKLNRIDNSAFFGCSSLTSIVIPDSVTTIGDSAFFGCSSLTSIVIPDSVTTIGDSAFRNCSSLSSVIIGNNVTTIGDSAFHSCSSLSSVIIGNNVTSIRTAAFYNCSSLVNIQIPDSITYIAFLAFEECNSLSYNEYNNSYYLGNESNPFVVLTKLQDTNITEYKIHSDTKIILEKAFRDCTSLISIQIPVGVTQIGSNAFRDCTSLTSIDIPNTVTSIDNAAFYNCTSLASISFDENSLLSNIGNFAFYNCDQLTSLAIPRGVTSIGESAFNDCDALESIDISNTVALIGDKAFYCCTSLARVTFANNSKLADIGEEAFAYCGLMSIQIPKNVASIGFSAFSKCSLLTHVIFEENSNLTTISKEVFSFCSSLTSVRIPVGVTYIGSNAFSHCLSLESIYIPNSIVVINSGAFWNCPKLNMVIFEENSQLELIGNSAFKFCPLISNIFIPITVTTIGDSAFYKCTSLNDVYYMGTIEDWAKISIGSDNSLLTDATIHYNYVPEE